MGNAPNGTDSNEDARQGSFGFDDQSNDANGGAHIAESHLTPDSAEATQVFNDLLALHGGNPTLALVHACEVLAQLSGAASAGYSRGPIVARVTTRSNGTGRGDERA